MIVVAWAAGIALSAAATSFARIVARGFFWLTSGFAALLAIPGLFIEHRWLAAAAIAALVGAVATAGDPARAGTLNTAGGAALVAQAALVVGLIPALTSSVALGAVTAEMMLGHWYLVDPRLPRWALRGLAIAGITGLVADGLLVSSLGITGGGPEVAFWVLLAASVVLMIAVVGALRYPAYSGVMAATGLSYLAVLTSLGAVFLGRAMVAGLGPFAI